MMLARIRLEITDGKAVRSARFGFSTVDTDLNVVKASIQTTEYAHERNHGCGDGGDRRNDRDCVLQPRDMRMLPPSPVYRFSEIVPTTTLGASRMKWIPTIRHSQWQDGKYAWPPVHQRNDAAPPPAPNPQNQGHFRHSPALKCSKSATVGNFEIVDNKQLPPWCYAC